MQYLFQFNTTRFNPPSIPHSNYFPTFFLSLLLYKTTTIYTLQPYFPLHKASSSHCGADSEHKAILVKGFCADKRFWVQHFAAPSAQYSCYTPTFHRKLFYHPSIFNKKIKDENVNPADVSNRHPTQKFWISF